MGFRLYDNLVFYSNYTACYAQRKNSYVIDTKGNLLKCTVALYDDKNKIGTLANDDIDDNKHSLWINDYDFETPCLNCKFLLVCKGGSCPKQDILSDESFIEKCSQMKQKILKDFELAIISNNINYELKAD